MAGRTSEDTLPELMRVGDWHVRPRKGVIERDGTVVAVRPRAMEVLVYLARKRSEVVSNDELIEQLWAPAIVGDDSVMVVVSELRRALGDDPKHPAYIARISKRGYQLIAAVGDGSHEPMPQSDLLTALESVAIAVLPFTNLSSDPEQEFFAEGIAEDILNGLAKSERLTVRARASSFSLKNEKLDLQTIGERLNVTHVVEGSIRGAGERIRVTAELSEVVSDRSVWSDRYDRDLTDIFEVQDAITREILTALNVYLGERRAPRKFPGTEAYNAFLRGRYHVNRRSSMRSRRDALAELESADLWLEKAVTLDPNNADAWATRARALLMYEWAGLAPEKERFAVNLDRALAVDPEQPLALGMAAFNAFIVDRDYQKSVVQLVDVVRRHPSSVEALNYLSLVLGKLGRGELADRVSKRTIELAPLDAHFLYQRYGLLLGIGYIDKARDVTEQAKALGHDTSDWSAYLAVVDGDIASVQALSDPGSAVFRATIAHLSGDLTEARRILAPIKQAAETSTEYQSFGVKHRFAIIEGDADAAVEYYLEAIEAGEPWPMMPDQRGYANVTWRKLFSEMYAHPGFSEVAANYGLDEDSLAKIRIPDLPF